MASFTGTFSAAGNVSNAILLKPGQSMTYDLTESAPGTWSVDFQVSETGSNWRKVRSHVDDVANTAHVNGTSKDQYVRLICDSIAVVTVDYSLDEDSGETMQDPIKNPVTGLDEITFTDNGVTFERSVQIDGDLNVTGSIASGGAGGADFVVSVTDDISMTSGDDFDLIIGADYTDTVTANYTSTVTGTRTLSSSADTVIEGTGAGDDVVLQAPFASSRVLINGGLTLVRATTAISASTSYHNILGVTDNTSARTVTLEADMNLAGRVIIIKDEAGTAGTANPITITPESGTIEGVASAVISENYGTLALYGDATNWKILFEDQGLTSQKSNATIVGAVAAPASGTTAVKIRRLGPFYSLTFTLTAARISVTDDAGNGSFGALKLFDFAEQGLTFLGCRQNYTAYTPDGTGVPTDAVFEIGIGTTAIVAAADGVLAAANDNVGGDVDQTLVAGTTTGTGHTGAVVTAIDGTGTAADLYLNWSGTAATIDGNGTIDVTATFTVVCCGLGDD